MLGLNSRQSHVPATTSARRTGQQRGLWEPADGTIRHRHQFPHQQQYQYQHHQQQQRIHQQQQRIHQQPRILYNPNEMPLHQQHPYQQRMPVQPGIIHRSGQEQSMATKKPALAPQVERGTDISKLSLADLWNTSRKTISDLEERVKEVYSQSDIRCLQIHEKHFQQFHRYY